MDSCGRGGSCGCGMASRAYLVLMRSVRDSAVETRETAPEEGQLRLRLTTGFMHMHKHTCSPVHAPLMYLHTCTLQTHVHPTSLHLYSCTSTHTDTLKLQSNPHPHLSVRPHSLAPVNSAAVSGDVHVSLPQSSRWSPRGYSPCSSPYINMVTSAHIQTVDMSCANGTFPASSLALGIPQSPIPSSLH